MTPSIIILLNLACFIFLYQTTRKSSINSANALLQVVGNQQKLKLLNLKHIHCIFAFLLVLIFHLFYDQSTIESFNLPSQKVFFPVSIFSILALLISIYTPLVNKSIVTGSEIHSHPPGQSLNPLPVFTSYFPIRTLYLISYEIFFRLTLINSLSVITDSVFAIIVSTILYGLHHRFSNKIEFYTSFLFGLVLSWLVIHTGSIFPAIILHLLLSLPFELRLIFHQKNLSI